LGRTPDRVRIAQWARLIHPFADEFFVPWPHAARGAACATRWYPVVPIALWLAVLGMSARSARSDTALT
jgi:hypothetical protein